MISTSTISRALILAVYSIAFAACTSSEPAIVELSLVGNPNPTVPLAAVLTVTTDRPTKMTINLDDGERQWSVTPQDTMATEHEVPVLGMRAGRLHRITATLQTADGNQVTSAEQTFETPALPDAFPSALITVHNPDAMEPGVTIFNVNGRWGSDGKQAPPGFAPAIVVNDAGEIIWYYLPLDHKVHDIRRLANGNFVYEVWPGTAGMIEIDMLGNIVRRWHFTGTAKNIAEGSIPVETDSFHHDFVELPNGNFLLLSSENRVVDNWYTSETDPDAPRAPANVIGDVIIEMTPSGEVLREWKLHDILDPYRIAYNSLREDFWERHYDGVVEGIVHDWTHGNAIIYEEDDNAFVMSVPYQDAVIKVSMDTGELVWILGNHDKWGAPWSDKLLTPIGDLEWSYKHHAISHTENGTYLLYDNGVARATPFDERMPVQDSYTRAVEYSVNEETMEVSQPWVYGPDDEPFYARYLGDVDWQPQTDNILITIGAQETDADGQNAPPGPGTQRWARLVEVTHDQPAEKVWEMQLKADDSGWSIYRSERLPGLYP
ncbi:MAG: aryl-sulfate sulfotransferase [Woeseiaceae bacterium]